MVAWMSRPVEKKTAKTKRSKNKDIIHPLFITIAGMHEDKFWVEIFNKCAYGTFPKDFNYKNGEIHHRHKNKLAIYQDTAKASVQIKQFFVEMGNIMSPHDVEMAQIELEEKQRNANNSTNLCWKDITTVRGKEILISRFVDNILSSDNHSKMERCRLFDAIKNGITLEYIKGCNIIMSNGQIVCIKGLVVDRGSGEYEISASLKNFKDTTPATPATKYSHSYMSDFSKLYSKKKRKTAGLEDEEEDVLIKIVEDEEDYGSLESRLIRTKQKIENDDDDWSYWDEDAKIEGLF